MNNSMSTFQLIYIYFQNIEMILISHFIEE